MYENYYSQDTVRKSVATSFLWMAFGLLVTAATSYLCYSSGWYLWLIYQMPMLAILFMFAQIGLVIAFQVAMRKAGTTGMKVLFMLYAFTLGISLTSILIVNEMATITLAFVISAIYFVCLGFIGFTTKKDLTNIGTLCFIGLFVMILSQVIMMIFRVPFDTRMLTIIGLLLFTGITAWDMQRMNRLLVMSDGDMIASEKIAIFMALELYLDFINIFLYILRLVGNNRD